MNRSESFYRSLLTFGMIPGLERIEMLLDRLGRPQDSINAVHVAGTNGKGSVCSMTASVLTRCGFKTGLYTSPYITSFNERMRINLRPIDDKELESVTDCVERHVRALSGEGVTVTEFEAVTAAALLWFKLSGCDYVVLETGLGGRFDATNVIASPLVSVITSVSLDHTRVLGDTVEQIAFEKSGIIKSGRPVVIADTLDSRAARVVSERASALSSRVFRADLSGCEIISESIRGTRLRLGAREYFIPFAGRHQLENFALAKRALELVLGSDSESVLSDKFTQGFAKAKNPARCEIVYDNPTTIFDGCHNEGSAAALKQIVTSFLSGKKICAVMGMMADKDVDAVLKILTGSFDFVYTADIDNPRAISSEELCKRITKLGVGAKSCGKAKNALDCARSSGCDCVIVCGSLYLCSELYPKKEEAL